MTPWTRLLHVFGAAALAVSLVLAGGPGRVALANGIGDLYVADPKGVQEVYLKTATILDQVPQLTITPSLLAFGANGQTLYASDGTTAISPIRISDLQPTGIIRASKPITAMAYPFGSSLFIAVAGSKTLGVLTEDATAVVDGPTLAAEPNLLAADPRETRLVAAAKGDTWVTIITPASSKMVQVGGSAGIGGKVVAMAVARAEGYVWVATSAPNRIALVSLDTGKVVSSAPLDAAPTGVAALGKYAVASTAASLVKVQGTKATAWATAPGPVLQVAADLSAQFLYLSTSDRVIALSVDNPKATPAASVQMKNGAPAALAPVPNRGSSLATSDTASGNGASPVPTGHAASTTTAKKSRAPSTDTIDDLLPTRAGDVDLGTLVLGIGAVVVGVLLGSRYVIKRLVGEP